MLLLRKRVIDFPFSNAVVELWAAERSKGAPVPAASIAAEPKEFDNHHVFCSIPCSPFVHIKVTPQRACGRMNRVKTANSLVI
jgi:hypothetical protein